MPTIPIYRQQTSVDAVPNTGRIDPAAAAAPYRATEQAGQALQAYGDAKRQEFDELRAEEAFNQLRERQMSLMLDPEKGFVSKKSKDAARQGFTEEYVQHFGQAQHDIGAGLSESQRRLFQRRAATAGMEFKNALMRHVLDQSNKYADEVFQGTLAVESNRAFTEWNNPYSVQSALERIDNAVARRVQSEGIGADAAETLLRDTRSKVHAGVVAAALEAGNVPYAEKYLERNGKLMNAVDALKVHGMVKKEADTRFALGTASAVVQSLQQQANPDEFQRLSMLVEGRESAGRQDAVSSAGAVGVMQVMPTTGPEAAKLAGLPWDEKRFREDANYNRALGQAYLAKQLQTFGGNVEKALAAYNAGPGTVSNAIAKAGAEGKPGEWRAYMKDFQSPANFKQTQDYLDAILPKFTSGGGLPARPTLEQVQAAVRARVGDSNPERLKLAMDEAGRQWKAAEDARKQREDEAVGEAFRLLEANGGRWDALPASLKSRVPGDKFGTLREYAGKVAKGEPIETDWDTYYQLRTDPALLQRTNLLALKSRLGDTEFKELARQQEEGAKGSASQTQVQTTKQRMDMRLSEMGVDPTPKAGGGDSKKVAQVWSLLDQQVRAAEAAKGKKLSPQEMDDEIDRLFTTVEVKGRLFGTSTRRTFELKPGDEIVVPAADRTQISAALKGAGRQVTEQEILRFYKMAKGLQ